MRHFLSKHARTIFRTFLLLSVTLMLTSACSDDDTAYTGRLNIEFTNWEPQWTNHVYITISPIDQENKIIKQIKVSSYLVDNVVSHSIYNIELNPGNYTVRLQSDNGGAYITRYVQIQIGKTEVIEI
ncbi:unknown [Prevotella sp. CAG:924]|nr:unknown [Prevotella sp. CAG:924]